MPMTRVGVSGKGPPPGSERAQGAHAGDGELVGGFGVEGEDEGFDEAVGQHGRDFNGGEARGV